MRRDSYQPRQIEGRTAPVSSAVWMLCTVALPLAIGVAIYGIARAADPRLLVASPRWTQAAVASLRHAIGPVALPEWAAFNLPDALWTFALGSAVAAVWMHSGRTAIVVALLAVLSFSVGVEVCQYAAVINGTFDPKDVVACFIAWVAAALVSTWRSERSVRSWGSGTSR